jgi:hypothetical protein
MAPTGGMRYLRTTADPDPPPMANVRRYWIALAALAGCGHRDRPLEAHVVGSEACRSCHRAISDSYDRTAHAATSRTATSATIKGSFAEGRNVLRTGRPGLYFLMTQRDGGFQQTAYDSAGMRSETEPIDLVIGSGRKGQTYLYRRDGLWLELPVSYLTGLDRWINSPGYPDGTVDFTRIIPPRCLECHSTSFSIETAGQRFRYTGQYTLGLSCEKCHGPGSAHVEYHQRSPNVGAGGDQRLVSLGRLPRERKLDGCALCHSGARKLIRPAFTYPPGDRLDDYLVPQTAANDPTPDVHGDQIALIRSTKCFQRSPGLTCTTCHDVHREQRDLSAMAQKCLQCHAASRHRPLGLADPAQLVEGCIDCHMPNQPSRALQINTPDGTFGPPYRSHRIAVYPRAAPTTSSAR